MAVRVKWAGRESRATSAPPSRPGGGDAAPLPARKLFKVRWATPNPKGDEPQARDLGDGGPDRNLFQDLPQGVKRPRTRGKRLLEASRSSDGLHERGGEGEQHHQSNFEELLLVRPSASPARAAVRSKPPHYLPMCSPAPRPSRARRTTGIRRMYEPSSL